MRYMGVAAILVTWPGLFIQIFKYSFILRGLQNQQWQFDFHCPSGFRCLAQGHYMAKEQLDPKTHALESGNLKEQSHISV